MRQSLLCLFLFLASSTLNAQYSGPESVEYDPVGDRYFVSNTTGSVIKVRTQAGAVSDFVAVTPAPYGLEIMGDVLYACSGGTIKGYALSNAAQVFNLNVGASFLNGLTTDGAHLYATDFSSGQRKVYKVDPIGNSYTVLVANTVAQPNGIVWDPVASRLVVVFWGSSAPIKAYDRVTGAETVLMANSGLGNIDGVTIDCEGNFVVASWSPMRISRFAPDFGSAGVNLGVTGLGNPADIDFDHVNNRICIPNSSNNTVTLFDIACNTGATEVRGVEQLRAVPNPTSGLIRVEPALTRDEGYMLLDARGLLVGGGSVRAGAMLDVGHLPSGTYTIEFTRTHQLLRVVRE